MTWDLLLTDCRVAAMSGVPQFGAIENAAIAISGDKIVWVGPRSELPSDAAKETVALNDRWVTPGLIDCHTHLVYGGDRAAEFEQRLRGVSYEEIAKAGGGILSTVKATRAATLESLIASASERLTQLEAEGVTTIEIKSGYGLDLENELKQLRAARALGRSDEITVKTTLLSAHAIPPEFAGRADAYIDLVTEKIIPAAAAENLADAVDAFCEKIAFTPEQTERVLVAAEKNGLPVKLHADQLSDLNGGALAARHRALSADHLEYTNEEGIAAMAKSGTVAVLLPGAFYFLRETKLPPIEALRRAGVPIAISTDSNPGSSPALSLILMLNMACTLFRLTPEEALAGVTREAARALGMGDSHGVIAEGRMADLAIWDIERPAELCYWLGGNPCAGVVKAGQWRQQVV